MKKYNYFENKYVACIVSTIMLFGFYIHANVTNYYYDAQGYMDISRSFFESNRFCFDATMFNIRGYTWPLMLAIFSYPGIQYVFWLFLSGLYSIIIVVAIGDFGEIVIGKRLSAVKRIIPIIMLMVFWPGIILYPLSDLIAVLISVLACYSLALWLDQENCCINTIVYSFLSGIFADMALNIRATYKIPMYLGLLFITIYSIKKRDVRLLISSVVFYLLGVAISAAPQVYANLINFDSISFDNPLSLMNGGNRSVVLLYEGAVIPRYETYVGNDPTITPAFYGFDPIMREVFRQEGISFKYFPDMAYFVRLVFKHPVEFMCVYFTHIVNCLDVRYGDMYILNFGGMRRLIVQIISVAIYTLLLIDIKRLGNIEIFKKIRIRWFLLIMYILLPTIISIPGHIEPRYAIAFHVVMYLYFAYILDWNYVIISLRKHFVQHIITYVVMLSCLTTIQNWCLSFAKNGILY